MNYKLHMENGREIELSGDRISCDDVVLPGDYNPHNVRLWVVGNEYGALGAVWAGCESDALDELIDAGLGRALLISEDDAGDETTRAGNYGEPVDLNNAWMQRVSFDGLRDWRLLMDLALAKGSGADDLS